RDVDARLDIRVPGRGPNAVESVVRDAQLSLYDDTLQAFLDGIPPSGSIRLEARGENPTRTQVWEHGGYLYVRTSLDMRSEFEKTMAAADGTRIYRLAPSPIITLSDRGVALSVRLELN
uniref:DotH/IcmK family type IV secretion protein n=1 Tax=Achromobacter insuavis TaxID=1287735 RepID=UPI001F1469DC